MKDSNSINLPKWKGGRFLVKNNNKETIEVKGKEIKYIDYKTYDVHMKTGDIFKLIPLKY